MTDSASAGGEWTFDIRVHGIRSKKRANGTSYSARWRVHGRDFQHTFKAAKLADGYRARLLTAARTGEPFSMTTGLPASMSPPAPPATWLDHCTEFTRMKWPHISPHHRRSIAETLTGITVALSPAGNGRPEDAALRRALYRYSFNATALDEDAPVEVAAALQWLHENSIAISTLGDAAVTRAAMEAISINLNGTAAARATVVRKRAVLHNCLEYAVERKLLPSNPLHDLPKRRLPPPMAVDRRVVVNPHQARQLLTAVRSVAPELEALFGCIYFAGLRPAEVRNLRSSDCTLPDEGWGTLLLSTSFQSVGPAWTDGGKPGEERQLKHRAPGDTRPVPMAPELVALLRRHVDQFPLGVGGRLFANRTGTAGVPLEPPFPEPVSMSTVYRAWHRARSAAFTDVQIASKLARRPYDLRHACLSTWLNAGVPPAQVAAWAGHTVAVLLRIYSQCIDGQDTEAKRRIEAALRGN